VTTEQAVQTYLDALNTGDADLIAACVSLDFYNEHTSALGHSLRGRDAYRQRLPAFLATFRGLHYEVEELIAEGDKAAVAYRLTATWKGDTAKPVAIRGMFRFQVADGLIAHRVDYWDGNEFQRQVSFA
jgi:steroid delta-isomerase-like uncharacterized protein